MTLFQLCNNYQDLSQEFSIDVAKAGKLIEKAGYKEYVPKRVRTICNKACAVDPARRYQSIEELRQAMERLRVAQDWHIQADLQWKAKIGTQLHEMVTDGNGPVTCVYLVNQRRKNANCTVVSNVDEARLHHYRWVANNTLS
ncbi:hypothetical protein [Bradyrhizobium sp.]|uniref:hypothetical protein n=1 Tax=Bradyrhizobium sp. TaxID=376 RepID=UPI001EB9485B|nr:hypothetical protein [Bradyrhizobium sp.]MBV8923012.1 hypothetical protein [Bradyrhizobium sp.]MBV9983694.1 hypothetical protein [Bradyrhizobium sp.]